MENLVISLCVVMCMLSTVDSLQCYSCNSELDGAHCKDLDNLANVELVTKQECPAETNACLLMITTDNTIEVAYVGKAEEDEKKDEDKEERHKIVRRMCGKHALAGQSSDCWTEQGSGTMLRTCYCNDGDLCNSASSLSTSITVAVTITLLGLLLRV